MQVQTINTLYIQQGAWYNANYNIHNKQLSEAQVYNYSVMTKAKSERSISLHNIKFNSKTTQ